MLVAGDPGRSQQFALAGFLQRPAAPRHPGGVVDNGRRNPGDRRAVVIVVVIWVRVAIIAEKS